MAATNIPRRQAIPILYTRGTHYDVGFDMGRTFSSIIKNFLQLYKPLNNCYLSLYNTDKGRKVYNETLESVKNSFPQYVRELEGVAEGAEVEFHKLFLMHMDDILPQVLAHENCDCEQQKEPVGCSSLILNYKDARIIGHTEDALSETLNHYYFVVAHIISDTPQGKYNIKEERFMSLCYAGHLPGFTMNYNHHGLVFTINTLAAEFLRGGKTPRHFLMRALLSTENFEEALKVLKDSGVGAADGCSINITYLNDPSKMCYNIEMAPVPVNGTESCLDIKEVPIGERNYHTNKYDRIKIEQANQLMLDSSIARCKTFEKFDPKSKEDIVEMLGDCSEKEHCVFRENGCMDEMVKTIAVGVFDLEKRTLALYSDNPKNTEPHIVLPLMEK